MVCLNTLILKVYLELLRNTHLIHWGLWLQLKCFRDTLQYNTILVMICEMRFFTHLEFRSDCVTLLHMAQYPEHLPTSFFTSIGEPMDFV